MQKIITHIQQLFASRFHDRIFFVGGIVRDLLAGQAGHDIDLIAALPEEVLAGAGFRLIQTKSAAPIYFRYDRDVGKLEVTRVDDPVSLYDDLHRRDFTINAMVMSLDGNVIDPLAARTDLEQGILRACSDRTFADDPARIFRAFRFVAQGWRLAPGTEDLIRGEEWTTALRTVPVERFSQEMLKALLQPDPALFFQLMLEYGVGMEILPEIFRMPEVPAGPVEHHPEGDLMAHSLQVLQRVAKASADQTVRFCALFHDLGKLSTDSSLYPRHHGHDRAGFVLAREFCDRLRLPAALRKALMWTNRLHNNANRWQELRDSTRIRLAEQAIQAGISGFLPLIVAADKGVCSAMEGWGEVLRIANLTTSQLGIDASLLASETSVNAGRTIPIQARQAYILQKRVEMLRAEKRTD